MVRDKLIELVRETPSIYAEDIADYLLANGVIVLPVAVGVNVWCLAQPCGGCSCFNEPLTEEFIEECRNCEKWEIIECAFDYDLISEFGKTVFASREEAETKCNLLMQKYQNTTSSCVLKTNSGEAANDLCDSRNLSGETRCEEMEKYE